jgi:hypothetical protein
VELPSGVRSLQTRMARHAADQLQGAWPCGGSINLCAPVAAQHGLAADCLQPPLRCGFRQLLKASVIAPRKAWRLLQGASPCRVRASHPPVASLASLAEPGVSVRRTRWAKRRQRILEAAGVTAPPEGLVQLRKGACCGRRGFSRTPKATPDPPYWPGWKGPPESSGRGRQEERRRSTGEAPAVPAVENVGAWPTAPEAPKGKPGDGTMLEPVHRRGTRPGRWRSTVTGKAHRMRLGSRIEQSTLRWGKPTTWGRTRRKHAARKGHASRTCRTGSR